MPGLARKYHQEQNAIARGSRLNGLRDSFSEGKSATNRDATVAKPFLKWAGGKGKIANRILEELPGEINDYYEPFLGGGAVFFAVHRNTNPRTRFFLSDINKTLIQAWKIVKTNPYELVDSLSKHEKFHKRKGSSYYSRIRDQEFLEDDIASAARLIYLNKTCFNGLYRVNRSGKFNVPIGSYKNPNICDRENILAVSKALRGKFLSCKSFARIQPNEGDLIYCDPPYDSTFTSYTDRGFDQSLQRQLRESCDKWRARGANIVISNSDTDLIRDEYRDYRITEIPAPRFISCKGEQRGSIQELLITSF